MNQYFLLAVCRNDENKEKEAGNGPFKKEMTNMESGHKFPGDPRIIIFAKNTVISSYPNKT